MELTVALDARYSIAPDGSVWAQAGMARPFWQRYLEVFDKVSVLARGAAVPEAHLGRVRVDGAGVMFHRVPDFQGPWDCLRQFPAIRAAVRAAAPARGAVILRVGSLIGNLLERELRASSRPYAVEVVGDPYEVFACGVVDHPLRAFFRWYFSRRLAQQCRRAHGVAYVTRQALQQRYPASLMEASISDVELPEEAFLDGFGWTHYSSVELSPTGLSKFAYHAKRAGPYQLVTVSSLALLYKGTDVLVEAIARCVRAGLDVTAVIAGDGQCRPALMAQAERAGVASRIRFAGWVTPGPPLWDILDAADLFVLPSRTEGLPRALVEAMARARPCLASAVGGTPELLDAADLVPVGDPDALAAKIREVLQDPGRLELMSRRNLDTSREYCDTAVSARRRRFYQHVRDFTEEWESRQSVCPCVYCA